MGQKVINGDLNVVGSIKHNGAEISYTGQGYTPGLGVNIDNDGVISLNGAQLEDSYDVVTRQSINLTLSSADASGLMAVATGQSDQPYEASGNYSDKIGLYLLLYQAPIHVTFLNDDSQATLLTLTFTPFGMFYIHANSEAGTNNARSYVPYVITIHAITGKLIAYPWDKFFGSASSGTGVSENVKYFKTSVCLNLPTVGEYVAIETVLLDDEDKFLAGLNAIITRMGSTPIQSITDFTDAISAIYANDPTQISTILMFLAGNTLTTVISRTYEEYMQSQGQAESNTHTILLSGETFVTSYVDDSGNIVLLANRLNTLLANGFTINTNRTKIEAYPLTVKCEGGADGSTELKMPCKKIVISSSDETDSGNVGIENAKFEFVLTKEMFDSVLTMMSTQTQTEITEDNLPTVWSALDRITRSGFANRLHGIVSTNPLCGDYIVGSFGDSDFPFQINSPVDDANDAMRFELDAGTYAEFFATSTSGDTLTIEDVEFDLGVKVAAGSEGGETVETEIKPEIYDIKVTFNPTSSSYTEDVNFVLTAKGLDEVKTAATQMGVTIESIDDLVSLFNDSQTTDELKAVVLIGLQRICSSCKYDTNNVLKISSDIDSDGDYSISVICYEEVYQESIQLHYAFLTTSTCVMSVSYVHQTIQTGSGDGEVKDIDFSADNGLLQFKTHCVIDNDDEYVLSTYATSKDVLSSLLEWKQHVHDPSQIPLDENTTTSELISWLESFIETQNNYNRLASGTEFGRFGNTIARIFDGIAQASTEVANMSISDVYIDEQGQPGPDAFVYTPYKDANYKRLFYMGDVTSCEVEINDLSKGTIHGVSSGSGGSGKLYVIDFDLSTKIPSNVSDAGTIVSSPQHYQMCFYESNVERIKALFANTDYSSIQTVQDLANAMNRGWNGSMTGSEAYTHGFLLYNLLSLCDAMLGVATLSPFGDIYARIKWVGGQTQGLGEEKSVITIVRKDLGGGDLDFLALDVNNSATVTEYGTSASGGGSSVDDSDILKNYHETLTFKDSNGNEIAGFGRTLLLKSTDWYYSAWNNSVQDVATMLSITVPTVTNSTTLQTAFGQILSTMQQAGASGNIIAFLIKYLDASGIAHDQMVTKSTSVYPLFATGDITWLLLKSDGTFADLFTEYDFTNAYSVDYLLGEVNVVD